MYRTKVWLEKCLAKNVKISIWQNIVSENIEILIMVVELQTVWQIKFGNL